MPMKDEYDQFLYMQVAQSANNTLTFGQLALGTSLFEYAGLIISRIEYNVAIGHWALILGVDDYIQIALCGSNSIASLALDQAEVYDMLELRASLSGTPASGVIKEVPIIHNFENMNGGGLLVPAQNMYIGVDSASIAADCLGSMRVWFRIKKLAAADYIELVQRLRVLST